MVRVGDITEGPDRGVARADKGNVLRGIETIPKQQARSGIDDGVAHGASQSAAGGQVDTTRLDGGDAIVAIVGG